MTEFSIIEKHCHEVGPKHKETVLGIGDDAAVIAVPDGSELVVSVDSMVAGVHFFPHVKPASLAHKLLAVNLSDLAAMGAQPKWATMTLTLPDANEPWLNEFSNALKHQADVYGVQLIGGDTTQGPLNLSLTVMGLVPRGKAISRRGAVVGDDLYVSNVVGDAALGLHCMRGDLHCSSELKAQLLDALEHPQARVELGLALSDIASACLDLSDGLVGDVQHICEQSRVAIEVDVDALPLSNAYSNYLAKGGDLIAALNGGDDYELVFTAAESKRSDIAKLAKKLGIALSCIGRVTREAEQLDQQKVSLRQDGKAYTLPNTQSYQHFSK